MSDKRINQCEYDSQPLATSDGVRIHSCEAPCKLNTVERIMKEADMYRPIRKILAARRVCCLVQSYAQVVFHVFRIKCSQQVEIVSAAG